MIAVLEASQVKLVVPAAPPGASNGTADLTGSMKRGSEEAYRQFFQEYFHRLLGYLLVITRGNESRARDLLQQTMIKVARHIRKFEEEQAFWRWLTVLARTSALDDLKKERRYFSFLERLWSSKVPPDIHEGERDFEEVVGASLNLLETEDQVVLQRKYIEGATVREIAHELGASEKSVESRLTRARARLKECLMEQLRHE